METLHPLLFPRAHRPATVGSRRAVFLPPNEGDLPTIKRSGRHGQQPLVQLTRLAGEGPSPRWRSSTVPPIRPQNLRFLGGETGLPDGYPAPPRARSGLASPRLALGRPVSEDRLVLLEM